MSGRPKTSVVLSQAERQQLHGWERNRSTARGLSVRARIILLCAEGLDHKAIAARLGTSEQTVSKWRSRFLADRLEGLRDAPRSGAPRTIDDSRVGAVIARTLERVRSGAEPCSTRSMAREMGMSHMAISRIWRQFGLQPHRPETFDGVLAEPSAAATLIELRRESAGAPREPSLRGEPASRPSSARSGRVGVPDSERPGQAGRARREDS